MAKVVKDSYYNDILPYVAYVCRVCISELWRRTIMKYVCRTYCISWECLCAVYVAFGCCSFIGDSNRALCPEAASLRQTSGAAQEAELKLEGLNPKSRTPTGSRSRTQQHHYTFWRVPPTSSSHQNYLRAADDSVWSIIRSKTMWRQLLRGRLDLFNDDPTKSDMALVMWHYPAYGTCTVTKRVRSSICS